MSFLEDCFMPEIIMKYRIVFLIVICVYPFCSVAKDQSYFVPLHEKGALTYYVSGHIEGFGETEFMVDTGSGYTTINEHTLGILKAKGKVEYSKQLRGILADGSEKIVSVYRVESLNLGGKCELQDVEVAIFPGKTRQILGLNALRRAGEFTFSFDPPLLSFAQCGNA